MQAGGRSIRSITVAVPLNFNTAKSKCQCHCTTFWKVARWEAVINRLRLVLNFIGSTSCLQACGMGLRHVKHHREFTRKDCCQVEASGKELFDPNFSIVPDDHSEVSVRECHPRRLPDGPLFGLDGASQAFRYVTFALHHPTFTTVDCVTAYPHI